MTSAHRMSRDDTGLLVIDVQEKLLPLIPEATSLVRNIAFTIDVAKLFGLSIQATEQYPKGLGGTVSELAERLPARVAKTDFSCCVAPDISAGFRAAHCTKLLLVGMETHVCVQQTALDLVGLGFGVFVAADAVASRDRCDHDVALRRMQQAGVIVTTCEAAAFEWAERSGTPVFKAFSRLVQDRMKAMETALST
jgi:nicotinamidase-related amidase